MTERNTVLRSMHDLGLAAWFGGSLMGAVGLNGAANDVTDRSDRARIASVGWGRWSPVNAAAIGAHLVGAAGLLVANRDRIAAQQGVGSMSSVKTALTAAAIGATAYSGSLGAKVAEAGRVDAEGANIPSPATPEDVAKAQQQLRAVQWIIPALTGALVIVSAFAGEQQKGSEETRGVLGRLMPGR
jgi:hypothetical protein